MHGRKLSILDLVAHISFHTSILQTFDKLLAPPGDVSCTHPFLSIILPTNLTQPSDPAPANR